MEQRERRKGYVVADDRATRTHDNGEYRPGDPVVLVRLFDRTGADTRRFTVRIYRERQAQSSTRATAEDQPVVGGTTAVAPRATRHITAGRRARDHDRGGTESLFRCYRWRRLQRHTTDAVPSEPLADAVPRGRPRTGADAS
ncbi:hypothetical protein JL720_5391 [Aureococcus anophagefferens]|nr:hypothetical protein JL720_5391 [Aureococcus anophagefferens]